MPSNDMIRRVTADTAAAGQAGPFQVVETFLCSAAIAKGDFVALDTDKTHQHRVQYVEQAGTNAAGNGLVIGVALDTTTAADQKVRVCVRGYCEGVNVHTSTAAGSGLVVAGTAGRGDVYAAGTHTAATPIAVALEADTANVADVFVFGRGF